MKWIKKIFDVDKKSFRRILKSFSNRANINHKKSNSWSICNIARKIVKWRDDWSRKRIRETLESKIRESIVLVWQKALIQWMLLFDRRTSFDRIKIERRNDEKDRKNSWNEFKNQKCSEMSSKNRQKTIEKSHRKEKWLERRIYEKEIFQRWSDAKCFICKSICEETNLIQTDQLLNARQRHRHSRLQRIRSISIESNNWFEQSFFILFNH
jgi:hypothetical protein